LIVQNDCVETATEIGIEAVKGLKTHTHDFLKVLLVPIPDACSILP
jgi:hypothetical protein